jgi:hypothetical protein
MRPNIDPLADAAYSPRRLSDVHRSGVSTAGYAALLTRVAFETKCDILIARDAHRLTVPAVRLN